MTAPALSLATFSSELADLIDRASAFVVSIDARRRRPGSGIVLGPDLVVTADHVLEHEEVTVRAGERRLAATIAGRDPASDIAVLRVAGLSGGTLEEGGAPKVGQLVVSLSRTAAGGLSAGLGLVNAVGGPLRTGRGVTLKQVIRTDAAARPGTSGGAIVDATGRVIAMTTSALVRGLPVGIPIRQLSEIAAALATSTSIKRAYLGVSVQPVKFPQPAQDGVEGGLLIFGVAREGAADRSGLLVGDVLIFFNDTRLVHADDLQDALATVEAGTQGAVTVIRGGALQRLEVTLGARPSA